MKQEDRTNLDGKVKARLYFKYLAERGITWETGVKITETSYHLWDIYKNKTVAVIGKKGLHLAAS